jgi:hypothetical protein
LCVTCVHNTLSCAMWALVLFVAMLVTGIATAYRVPLNLAPQQPAARQRRGADGPRLKAVMDDLGESVSEGLGKGMQVRSFDGIAPDVAATGSKMHQLSV